MSLNSTLERNLSDSEEKHHEQLLRYVEENQVGYNSTLQGPFGSRKGRALLLDLCHICIIVINEFVSMLLTPCSTLSTCILNLSCREV